MTTKLLPLWNKKLKFNGISNLIWFQVEIVGQLSGQMLDMVGGVVETVGEEPEPESEGFLEQHEEEEELTRVRWNFCFP